MKTYKNFIGGHWVEPSTKQYFENRNPADTTDVIGHFPLSALSDVDRAVASAKRGFEQWRRAPAPARGDVLRRVGDIMSARKDEIAALMTREMGKPLAETRGDVQEGIDTAYYAASEGRRLFGHTVPSELRNKWAMSFRRPIGVCGIISPFNFPMAIPTWKMFPALVCGNACVFKPAEDVPHTGTVLVELMLEAGLPLKQSSSCTVSGKSSAPRSSSIPTSRLSHSRDRPKRGAWLARSAVGCTSAFPSRWAGRTP